MTCIKPLDHTFCRYNNLECPHRRFCHPAVRASHNCLRPEKASAMPIILHSSKHHRNEQVQKAILTYFLPLLQLNHPGAVKVENPRLTDLTTVALRDVVAIYFHAVNVLPHTETRQRFSHWYQMFWCVSVCVCLSCGSACVWLVSVQLVHQR